MNFVVISPHFSIFKNVVHSSEPGETPSYLKITKHLKTVAVRLRLIFQFTYVQYCINKSIVIDNNFFSWGISGYGMYDMHIRAMLHSTWILCPLGLFVRNNTI